MSKIDTAIVKRALALGGARTGVLMSPFSDMHKVIEEIMERPVYTSEMGTGPVADEIQEKAKEPFSVAIAELLEAIEKAEAGG